MRIHHENNGQCPSCEAIFNRYTGFYLPLKWWFQSFQKDHREAHISCAGRNAQDQTELFHRGATRAQFPESAHNWNCAIDVFCMLPQNSNLYDVRWFTMILGPHIPDAFIWYGQTGSRFFEFPHIELKDWGALAAKQILTQIKD